MLKLLHGKILNETWKLYYRKWIEGDGEGQQLYNAVNGEMIATATTKGLDFAGILDYGRKTGAPLFEK